MAKRKLEEPVNDANGDTHNKVDAVVVGIGQLGLCFALTLEKAGLSVIGVDTRADMVQAVNDRTFTSKEPGVTEQLQHATNFEATTDMASAAKRSDLIFILVATPTSGNAERFYDHSMVSNVLAKLNEELFTEKKNVVINATVMPGYIATSMTQPQTDSSDPCIGSLSSLWNASHDGQTSHAHPPPAVGKLLLKDCPKTTLSYNPAFVAQGDIMDGYRTGGWFGMVLIGGADQEIAQQLKQIYLKISGDVPVNVQIMSPESGEICKLASNCFRTTKISFANMVGDVADATVGADKHDICTALGADRSIGPLCMKPGYGYGGPCYPRDNQAFGVYAQSVGVKPSSERKRPPPTGQACCHYC
jgi:UDP-glucose 6-dehydrogenase